MYVQVLQSIHDIPANAWNGLDLDLQPFLRHEFLAALEDTGCASTATGWTPQHLVILDTNHRLVGAVPLYLKSHSMGEFVFDFSWAQFYDQVVAQNNLAYYPKLVASVPFTPATGPRLLVTDTPERNHQRRALIEALVALTQELNLSSTHALFPSQEDYQSLSENGWLTRTSCQFHWHNRGYQCMDEFLGTFRADKRKKSRRERRRVLNEYGIQFQTLQGADLGINDWRKVFSFTQSTFHQHGHEHYLTPEFFHAVAQALPDQVMVKLAEHHGKAVASAIFFQSKNTLYGRYWGAQDNYDSLHFETCYYQGIEYCIERGLQLFEPGTQGEHKIARGFEPTLAYSAHHISDHRFHSVLAQHLIRERQAVNEYAAQLRQHVPYHRQTHPVDE